MAMTKTEHFSHDHLTGLGDLRDEAVAPVRVEVLHSGSAEAGVAGLRQSVALAQERLQTVKMLQEECAQLRLERDQLLQQLAEVAQLQRQLQQSLDQN